MRRRGELGIAAAAAAMPGWVGGLMGERFFVPCRAHENRKKNEKNIYCLGCCDSICPHCAPAHSSHLLLQVRRYVYNDVVRLDDLDKLIDCSYIQPYTINGAKVIFLKQRPQSRLFKGAGNICLTCERILQEPFHFCSLSCKVDHVILQCEDLSSILFRFDESEFAFPHFENLRVNTSDLVEDEDLLIDTNSILEEEDPRQCSGCSGSSSSDDNGEMKKRKKKNKKSGGFLPQIVLSLSNRRKGAPHRSPLS